MSESPAFVAKIKDRNVASSLHGNRMDRSTSHGAQLHAPSKPAPSLIASDSRRLEGRRHQLDRQRAAPCWSDKNANSQAKSVRAGHMAHGVFWRIL